MPCGVWFFYWGSRDVGFGRVDGREFLLFEVRLERVEWEGLSWETKEFQGRWMDTWALSWLWFRPCFNGWYSAVIRSRGLLCSQGESYRKTHSLTGLVR